MGGVPCAKIIIDAAFAIMRALGCMATSIFLAAIGGASPTQDMADRFVKAGDALAMLAAEIEKSMREGGGESWAVSGELMPGPDLSADLGRIADALDRLAPGSLPKPE